VSERALIVNGDDFGLSDGTNAGIARAHEDGILTSASLMVFGDAAPAAAEYARTHPELSVGLHVDVGEWEYRDGEWLERYARGPAEQELPRQLDRFRALMGRDPTHLDSHQHIHRDEPATTLFMEVARGLDVPLRDFGPVRYEGGFYGQTGRGEPLPDAIRVEALIELIESLPPGVTELGCHPGLDTDLDSSYQAERLREVEALCAPRVQEALKSQDVALRSF
jgi:chitin disaccharide deacetylase